MGLQQISLQPTPDMDREDGLDCTPLQLELLSQRRKNPFVSLRWNLSYQGLLSFERISYTWQAIASHNEILRIALVSYGQIPDVVYKQVILKHVSPIRLVSHEDQITQLEKDSPAQLTVTLGTTHLALEINIPYALTDRTSLAHIQNDFKLFYDGLACQYHVPFSDYVREIGRKDSVPAISYWRELLSEVETAPISSLPNVKIKERSETCLSIEDETLASMHNVTKQFGVTTRGLVYAAWATTLSYHIQDDDNKVLFAVVGRDQTVDGHETLVGAVDQTYPLKLTIPRETSILEWIHEVETADLEASANAFLGYKEIVMLAPSIHPQVKVILVEDSIAMEEEEHVEVPLTLIVNVSSTPSVSMIHDLSIAASKIQVLLQHFLACLSQIVNNHAVTASGVDLITPSERRFLLKHGEPTTKPLAGLIHTLFEQQVERTPDANAVQFESESTLTYSQLNSLANQVARQLDCVRGNIIPICMNRSTNLIIALLAVLKKGAAYVIIDPETPGERQRFIVADVSAPFVLVDEHTKQDFPYHRSIDALVRNAEGRDSTNLKIDQQSNDIAYIIYTSGSTGKPKGVVLEHSAAFAGLAAFPFIPNLRQLLFHNPVFSAAQRSIFSTLKQGGCLCLASKTNLTVNIEKTINTMAINVIDVTPSMASLITPGSVTCLRRMTVAGESINPALLPLWMEKLELLNAYGLSEVTQINWRHVMRKGQNPQNIGRPNDTTTSYVLLPGTTRLAPLLVPGELCLGGHQLARHYLNRPEKTLESFIQNPFGPGRLYRTGDMVVVHEDGSIEMIGRIDFQTKINDQRVEPGEANAIIQTHPGVSASWVVSASMGGKKSLVAVVVPRESSEWLKLAPELRERLQQALPSYMVPSYWLVQSELPLNINGKVDVSNLRGLVQSLKKEDLILRPASTTAVSLTRSLNKTEETMRDIWAHTLAMPKESIGLDDSFQSLGGTSLEAIMVVSRARELSLEARVPDVLLNLSLLEVAKASKWIESTPNLASPAQFSLLPKSIAFDRNGLEDAYPVTPFQEALIADSVLGHSKYVSRRLLEIQGLKLDQLQKAFIKMAETDVLLRTTFIECGRSYLQVVRKDADIFWQEFDVRLEDYLADEGPTKMSLGSAFIKIAAIRKEYLVITLHHALFDFWSKDFLFDDLFSILEGQLPVQRPSFSNYVRYLQEQTSPKTSRFWEEYLRDARPTKLGFRPGQENSVEVKVNLDFKSLATKAKVGIGAILYTAWALVLFSITSNDDVIFGVTLSGRDAPIPSILLMKGPVMECAPIRVKIDRGATILKLAQSVQLELWKIAEHAHFGIRNISRASGQPSNIFDSMVNFLVKSPLNTNSGSLEPPKTLPPNFTEYAKLELDGHRPECLVLSSTIDRQMAHKILTRVAEVLHTITHQPETLVSRLDPTNLLGHWNQSIHEAPESSSQALAHSYLEAKALETPNKIAMESGSSQKLSYRTFNARANQLADFLRFKGIQPEDVVPLYLEKSLNTLVSIFGVMKAGGAFCPLDPKNPRERNIFIIQDVKAKIALTDRANLPFFQGLDCEAVVIEDIDFDAYSYENTILPALRPQNLVYIIYTSGSTGMPKGVLVTHASLSASTIGMIEATGVDSDWRALWVLNYVFDGSYYDVFSVIGAGGTLVVADQSKVVSQLATCINDFEITHLMVTPTIASTITPAEVPGLKFLLMGGEPLVPSITQVWAPHIPVYSVYGPTEATILMTVALVKADSHIRNIGSPIRSVIPLILNLDDLQPVPFGEVGELCVSGIQVARGYLNRAEATKAAFLKSQDGTTIYRTGDLARQLPNDQIELLGRKDNQVKLNGFRIELGEIENAILRTGDVNACIVATAMIQDKKQLVAFFLPKSEEVKNPELSETLLLPADAKYNLSVLKSKLTTLTHYMMPGLWVPLAFIPLLPSGKTDRKKLVSLIEQKESLLIAEYRDWDGSGKGEDEFCTAKTDMELLVQDAWAQVFQTPATAISTSSKFYSLGGDSISAINLVNACRRLGYELAVGDVLAYPTIREQAKRLIPSQTRRSHQVMGFDVEDDLYKRLQDAGVNKPDIEEIYPCTPGQVEFLTQGHSRHQFWQLMTVRRLPKDFDINRWIDLTTRLTAANQILRAMFAETKEGSKTIWAQVILKKPVLDLQFIDCPNNAERQAYVDNLWQGAFKLGKPFVQYRILKSMEDGSQDLCIKLDHAMYDGTLFRIFDEQFTSMAKGIMPPKPTEFKNLVQYCRSANRKEMLEFWINLLHGKSSPYLSHIKEPKVGKFVLGKMDTRINSFAEKTGVTVSIVFQTAYTLLLSRMSKSKDVMYDNLLTGRNVDLDEPQLINGNCANFLPFRSQLKMNTTIRDLLHETQSLFWKTTENGLVGLGDIYTALNADRQDEAARALFCFQPFDPPPSNQDHMRWIVMSLSKNTMFFNYGIILEVFKDVNGYKTKFQYDPRALTDDESKSWMQMYGRLIERLQEGIDKPLREILEVLV